MPYLLHRLLAQPDWRGMLGPGSGLTELLLRPALVYGFLLTAFKFSGKRELSQATLFDFLVVLLIANVVQNAMIGQDTSVLGSFVGVSMLLALAWMLNRTTSRSRLARRLLEGMPTLLVHDGRILEQNMRRESVARNDLLTALREQGIASLAEVRYAVLELDGRISVIRADALRPEARDNCVTAEILEQDPAIETPGYLRKTESG